MGDGNPGALAAPGRSRHWASRMVATRSPAALGPSVLQRPVTETGHCLARRACRAVRASLAPWWFGEVLST